MRHILKVSFCLTLFNEAMQYKKAYFDLLARYCDTVDEYIADVDRKIEES